MRPPTACARKKDFPPSPRGRYSLSSGRKGNRGGLEGKKAAGGKRRKKREREAHHRLRKRKRGEVWCSSKAFLSLSLSDRERRRRRKALTYGKRKFSLFFSPSSSFSSAAVAFVSCCALRPPSPFPLLAGLGRRCCFGRKEEGR